MLKEKKRRVVILLLDFLIALFIFGRSCYFGDLTQWYWLITLAGIWTCTGAISSKLNFGAYKRIRYAFMGILTINIIVGVSICFYCDLVLGLQYDYTILLTLSIITVLEWALYYCARLFVYRKIPYYYEEPPISDNIEPIKETNYLSNIDDVNKIISYIKSEDEKSIEMIGGELSTQSVALSCSDPEKVLQIKVKQPSFIILEKPLNAIRHINTLFAYANYKLEEDGYVVCKGETSAIRYDRIMQQIPYPLNSAIYFIDYFNHRVLPKLPIVKRAYYWITKGDRRVLTRVEILGRLCRAGFDVVCESVISNQFYVVAKKVKHPIRDDNPSSGLLIRLKRSGKNGKILGVYKFRTMYAYSEYLQPYIYRTEGISNGKYANDYRVNKTGKFMRKTFMDELPMLINWLKGDLKLVGVRPLSSHFLSLYSKELQELRSKTKPGLIPPYYIIKPKTIEDKMNIELEYLRSYYENPLKTDWVYFWKIFKSIVFKGVRGE